MHSAIELLKERFMNKDEIKEYLFAVYLSIKNKYRILFDRINTEFKDPTSRLLLVQ